MASKKTQIIDQPDNINSVVFRWLGPYREQKCPERMLTQAIKHGMNYNDFARMKLCESLDDDRLDHIAALIEQLHAKVRDLEETNELLRKNHRKGMLAILIHVCDLSPENAHQILSGEQPI